MTLSAVHMYKLLRLRAPGHHSIGIFLKMTKITRSLRFFAVSCVNRVDNDAAKTTKTLFSGRKRSLSPLERISSLLPQDSLTPEVEDLRLQDQLHYESDISRLNDNAATQSIEEKTGYVGSSKEDYVEKADELQHHTSSEVMKDVTEDLGNVVLHHSSLQGETPLTFGEVLVAEHRKKGEIEFRKMFQLLARTRLQSSWGVVLHEDIAGKPAGSFIKTNRGVPILIRRASLEDYVLFMKRGPAIAYPKEASAMLMMMDITEGDCVLEAGSGSGAMSLFLSRAVGASGRVMSVDVREDHLKRSVLNYNRWRASWALRRGRPWPDNVEFLHADLCTATSILEDREFNAIALDLIHPHLVLSTVIPHLHSGAVCAIYLANITQVIDLLEGLRCLRLPLLCERIMELPSRDWLVAPALKKDGSYCIRKSPVIEENFVKEDSLQEQHAEFGSIPYIARPHPEQLSHAAFMVKLRKCVQEVF